MKEKTTKRQLIRRLHTLAGIAGLSRYDYEAMLAGCGVSTSTDLDESQLESLCRFLQGMADGGKQQQMDSLRKSLLAAVCQYLEAMDCREFLGKDRQGRIAYAQGVACRAAQVGQNNFNRIGMARLRSLTAMFNKMRRDMDGVLREAYKALET